MTIQKNIEKSTATLTLSGWLDTKTSPELKEALNNLDLPVEVVTDEEFAVRIREACFSTGSILLIDIKMLPSR
jgi:hypothetical protein